MLRNADRITSYNVCYTKLLRKAKEEFKLRGFSHHTQSEYLGVLQRFILYYENCPIDNMGEREIREYLLYLIDHEKSSGTRITSYNVCYTKLLRFCSTF